MSKKRTDVVLIDSDSEEVPSKVSKTEINSTSYQIMKQSMSSDDDDDDDDEDEDEDEVSDENTQVAVTEGDHGDDDDDDEDEDGDEESDASTSEFGSSSQSDSDKLEPISVEEYKAAVLEAEDNASDNLNQENTRLDTDNRSSFQDPTRVPPEVRLETRKYLKSEGMMKFLDKYLPTTASAEDILNLILRLGFLPKDIDDVTSNDEDNLIKLIQILNLAMKKTLTMRNRLTNFNSMGQFLSKLETSSKIMVITGAGISTSLGIPDFRSSKGFYNQVLHLGLSDPQEVFDLDFFHQDPSIFYLIAHMVLPPEHSYTPLHAFIKLLQDKGKLLRNYTQNIDNLEGVVGIENDKLIQCHGSFATALCVTCGYQVDGEVIFPEIRLKEIPYCPKCTPKRKKYMDLDDDNLYVSESFGVFKPDITFFGEPLPSRFHRMIKQDLNECDLLICIGTSLKVAPVSHILDRVPEDIPQILINKDPIDHFNLDLSILGYCDEAASYICNELGWELPHKDYDTIRGESGNNLVFEDLAEPGMFLVRRKEHQTLWIDT